MTGPVTPDVWPTGTMSALVFTAPGVLELVEVPIPPMQAGHVLVQVRFLGICGTDVHLMDGTSAYVVGGLTTYPIRFGHEWAGQVVAVGAGVGSELVDATVVGEPFLSCGQCLTCRGGRYNLCPHRFELGVRGDVPGAAARFLSIPASNVHVVPPRVDLAHAVIAEPAVTVLHAFETGAVQPGEAVVVLGTGTLGLIAVQVAVSMGCPVDVVGIDEAGLQAALDLGARAAMRPEDAPADAYAVVLEATGAPGIGPTLTHVAGIGARILQVGIPGRPVDAVDLAAFVAKGLELRGVLGGVHLVPRALQLVEAGAIDAGALVEAVLPVGQVHTAFERMHELGRARPKLIVDLESLTAEVDDRGLATDPPTNEGNRHD